MKQMVKILLAAVVLTVFLGEPAFASASLLERAINLTATMESSGDHGGVANDSNGSPSVGILQWNNTRAVDLLKKIIADDSETATAILGGEMVSALLEGDAYVWSGKVLTDSEMAAIRKLLLTESGVRRQDEQARYDVLTYINRGRSLGIVNPSVLVYYADITHQVGLGNVRKYADKAASLDGGYDKITLKTLHEVALEFNTYTITRRKRMYESLTKNPARDDGVPTESVRIDPDGIQLLYPGDTLSLYARISPAESTTAITWTASRPKIAEVSGGLVTALEPGITTVSADISNGARSTIVVIVLPQPKNTPQPTEAP